MPLSVQVKSHSSPSRSAPIRTSGGASPWNLSALAIRFWNRAVSSELSPLTVGKGPIVTRARDLARSNAELEQFAYVASHDLQEPLRKVASFCQLLEQRYKGQLDERADQYIEFAVDGAKRMQQLINDLLAFSRIGKKEVRKSTIDTTALVKEVFAEISQAHHNQAQVTIHTLPESCADLNLLRQVWTNLISNAIKYSAKKESPRIEIGFANHSPNGEYFIRDNGAGFDMGYAGKLFGTFQRLHDSTDFEGMGIGLAIVQRIIHKHGGTIRAEAAVEKGATFFFTLPG